MRRYEFKKDLLIDLGRPSETDVQDWFNIKLIHPYDAIQWIATGRFHSQPVDPVRMWCHFADSSEDFAIGAEAGRVDLATDIVIGSIATGRLRCAFVGRSEFQDDWSGAPRQPKLEVVSPEVFLGNRVELQEEEGFGLIITDPNDTEDDEKYISIEGFLFFWDEVEVLRPAGPSQPASEAPISSPSSSATLLPRSPLNQSRQAGSRGRRARHYGGPIARFLARTQKMGLEDAAKEKDETLGRWLIEEFEACGETQLPNLRNAAADARGALAAWISALAQNDRP